MSDPSSAPLPEIIKGATVRLPRPKTKTSNTSKMTKGRGRPPGAMNKEKLAIREFSRETLMDPKFQKKIAKVIQRGNPDELKKIMPLIILYHYYAFGRPKHTVQLETPENRSNKLVGRTLEEIRDLYAKAAELRALRDGSIIEMRPVAFEPVPEAEKVD